MHALIKKIANFFGVLDKNTVKKGHFMHDYRK